MPSAFNQWKARNQKAADRRGYKHPVAWKWSETRLYAEAGSRPLATGRAPLVPLLISAIAALAYGVLVTQILEAEPRGATAVPVERTAELGGLWLTVQSTQWISPSDKMEEGLTTPATPANRWSQIDVGIALQNDGDQLQKLGLEEFWLRAGSWDFWPTGSNPFLTTVTLRPRQALNVVLSFVLPETGSVPELVWTRDGREILIPIGNSSPPIVATRD